MRIKVTSGVGKGLTEVSTFDSALLDAGIGNYNLIEISSVIPPGSKIEVGDFREKEAQYGDKIYLVLSKQYEETEGEEAWSGLGWTQDKKSGKGLFLEGSGSSEEEVVKTIRKTFLSVRKKRSEKLADVTIETTGIECEKNPVCAITAAVYKNEDW